MHQIQAGVKLFEFSYLFRDLEFCHKLKYKSNQKNAQLVNIWELVTERTRIALGVCRQ